MDGYFRFPCPNCNKRLKCLPSHAGRMTSCTDCGQRVRIPADPERPAEGRSAPRDGDAGSEPEGVQVDIARDVQWRRGVGHRGRVDRRGNVGHRGRIDRGSDLRHRGRVDRDGDLRHRGRVDHDGGVGGHDNVTSARPEGEDRRHSEGGAHSWSVDGRSVFVNAPARGA